MIEHKAAREQGELQTADSRRTSGSQRAGRTADSRQQTADEHQAAREQGELQTAEE